MYLLDTDHLGILQLRDGEPYAALRSKLDALPRSAFYVSIVSFHEQLNGWQAYLRKQLTPRQVVYAYRRLEGVIDDFSHWKIASFDDAVAERFDSLRHARVRIGAMDLRIASTALVRDYTVLTRNVVDFQKVPGLKVEDWTVVAPDKPR